ncbi:hypothetical protein DL96DRAFT_1588676 [Flagelloscypha sp. PMI_526]|nr:hypothetical protein DL96DRAFT_1588676 [Flagelloscypha sp. PMI_526]
MYPTTLIAAFAALTAVNAMAIPPRHVIDTVADVIERSPKTLKMHLGSRQDNGTAAADAGAAGAAANSTADAGAAANSTADSGAAFELPGKALGKVDLGGLLSGDLSSLGNVDIGSLISDVSGLFDGKGDVVDELSKGATDLLGQQAGDAVKQVGDVVSGKADVGSLLSGLLGGGLGSLLGGGAGAGAAGAATASASASASATGAAAAAAATSASASAGAAAAQASA